jgi:putative ABC transport system permease protein
MIHHYLLVAVRHIRKSLSTFIINVTGLSCGLLGAIFMYLWVWDELNVDQFHPDHLYQVISNTKTESGIQTSEPTSIGMAHVIRQSIGEIEYAATVTPNNWFPKFIVSSSDIAIKSEAKFAGEDFFRMFSFPFLFGDANALSDKSSVVVTRSLADKLFSTPHDAIGQRLKWKVGDLIGEAIITAVVEDPASRSSEQFEILFPIALLRELMGFANDELNAPGPSTYVLLRSDADVTACEKKITDLIHKRKANSQAESFVLVPFKSKFLYGKFVNGVQVEGRMVYVRLCGAIGILTLLLACVNFINLSTARSSKRIREIGIRKALGVNKAGFIGQYLLESGLTVVFAFLAAALVSILLLPTFNAITGKTLTFDVDSRMLFASVTIIVLTTIASGLYPALQLSSVQCVTALKSRMIALNSPARKVLVMFQVVVSVVFVAGVVVVYKQLEFVQSKDLGYDRHHVIYFEIEGSIPGHEEAFVSQLENIPGVVSAGAMVGNFVGGIPSPKEASVDGQKIPFDVIRVNYGLIETLQISLVEGRNFSAAFADENSVIINREAAERLSIKDPVGKVVDFNGDKLTIVGVTENFHNHSLHAAVVPLAIRLETQRLWNLFIRVTDVTDKKVLTDIASLYHKFNPDYPFDYRFLDNDYNRQYQQESRLSTTLNYMAITAVVISALGLLGLAAFDSQRRIREIGIRKVFGASVRSILVLICKDLVVMVVLALVVAIPLSLYLAREWLSGFAYAVNFGTHDMLLIAIVTVVITLFTVGSQAISAATSDPVSTIRTE